MLWEAKGRRHFIFLLFPHTRHVGTRKDASAQPAQKPKFASSYLKCPFSPDPSKPNCSPHYFFLVLYYDPLQRYHRLHSVHNVCAGRFNPCPNIRGELFGFGHHNTLCAKHGVEYTRSVNWTFLRIANKTNRTEFLSSHCTSSPRKFSVFLSFKTPIIRFLSIWLLVRTTCVGMDFFFFFWHSTQISNGFLNLDVRSCFFCSLYSTILQSQVQSHLNAWDRKIGGRGGGRLLLLKLPRTDTWNFMTLNISTEQRSKPNSLSSSYTSASFFLLPTASKSSCHPQHPASFWFSQVALRHPPVLHTFSCTFSWNMQHPVASFSNYFHQQISSQNSCVLELKLLLTQEEVCGVKSVYLSSIRGNWVF